MTLTWNEYKSQKFRSEQLKGCLWVLISLVLCLLLGLVGHYHLINESKLREERLEEPYQDEDISPYELSLRKCMRKEFDPTRIKDHLSSLTHKPHLAGSKNNLHVAEYIADTFRKNGLEDVHFAEYGPVLLSYPDFKKPNTVTQFDESSGEEIFISKGLSKPVITGEQDDPSAWVKFSAYAGNGSVTGKPVYCNYGTEEDFRYLRQSNIPLEGAIAIIRYGAIFRGDKIWEAQRRNMSAVILYTDPADQAREGYDGTETFPKTVWMPAEGAQRGTLMRTNGDPLTPSYPAKNYTYRSESLDSVRRKGQLPSIPVLPLSYGDIYPILRDLRGREAPKEWQGGLNFTYRLGPGYKNENLSLKLNVSSKFEKRKIQNVIGYIRGSQEPDEYVIVGNHYDAWTYGSIDPNSGTAVMLELSRVLGMGQLDKGWLPQRTIIFCAWDAEEYGLIGSTEWVEENLKILEQRAVAYVNVDLIPGNYTLMVETTPMLYRLAVKAAKAVRNPRQDEVERGRRTVYDTWIAARPNGTSWDPSIPHMPLPEDGSDHAPFLKLAGVPVLNFRYENLTLNPGASYPLYHTLYETQFLPETLMDPDNFSVHVAVGQYWAEVVRLLTDSYPVPFDVQDLAFSLLDAAEELESRLQQAKVPKKVMDQFNLFNDSLARFLSISSAFQVAFQSGGNPLYTAPIGGESFGGGNKRLIALERCFISSHGPLPGQKGLWRNVIWGTDPLNQYQGSEFPGIYGALAAYVRQEINTEQLLQQLSIAQYAIECAILTLKDTI